jgi:hypothetical protein
MMYAIRSILLLANADNFNFFVLVRRNTSICLNTNVSQAQCSEAESGKVYKANKTAQVPNHLEDSVL